MNGGKVCRSLKLFDWTVFHVMHGFACEQCAIGAASKMYAEWFVWLAPRLAIIKKDNDRLTQQCQELRTSREERDNQNKQSRMTKSSAQLQQTCEEKSEKRIQSIPGLPYLIVHLRWKYKVLDCCSDVHEFYILDCYSGLCMAMNTRLAGPSTFYLTKVTLHQWRNQ